MKRLPKLLPLTLGVIALLALACAPATEPEAAPAPAAPTAPEVAAPAPQTPAVPKVGEVPTTGTYIERTGLRIFIPEGYEFGGPVIPPDPRPPRYGGTAVASHPGDPPSLDPYHTTSYLNDFTAVSLYDRLVRFSTTAGTDIYNNPMIGGLAESWDVSDDFLTYTFHLRQGVKFQNLPPVNGRELDAEDVKATVELYKAPGSVAGSFYERVDRVEVVDQYTVALHMKEVEPGMLNTLAESIRGSIMPREMTDPASHVRRPGGIGTGPFMVDSPYEFKVGITLRRNPDYWLFEEGNRLPYLDGRRVVVIPDNSASLTAFRTGKIDFGTTVVGGVAGMRALMKSHPTTLVQEYIGFSVSCFCFRLDKEPWSDVRVRRAMSLALDYETIAQTISGTPPLAVNALISGFWHGSDDRLTTVTKVCGCPWYNYDPGKAKALLGEAGFPNGFSTDLAFFAYTQSTIEQTELLAAYWKAIGVDAKILSQDYTVYRRNVDLGGWENIGRSFSCCPGVTTIYGAMGALIPGGPRNTNMGFINDPKMTAMAKEIIASYKDEARQRALIEPARAYSLDQVFIIPNVAGTTPSFFAPRLRNYQPLNKITAPYSGYAGTLHTWIDDDWSFAR